MDFWAALGTGVAITLTIMVYTYLIGDNVLFRLAEHVLVGVSVGWAVLQVFLNLIYPVVLTIRSSVESGAGLQTSLLILLIPLLLGGIMVTRPLRASKPLTNLIMALIIGTVAALSLAGALSGTLLPQIGATMLPLNDDPIGRIVLLIGTLASLWYFQFTVFGSGARVGRGGLAVFSDRFRILGRWSIMLAFGAVFAGVFLTYFAAFIERLLFLINVRF